MLRKALTVLLLILVPAQAAAAVESILIRSRLDPNAIEITGIDVLFLYDEATAAQIPATKSAWYANRRSLTRELGEAFDLVSTFIPQGFDSARPVLPERAGEAIRVLVFAEHEASETAPVDITGMSRVLIEIDPFGIRVSAEYRRQHLAQPGRSGIRYLSLSHRPGRSFPHARQ